MPMTRDELRKKYPDYDKKLALEKIIIEDYIEDTCAGNFRKKWSRRYGIGLAAAAPVIDFLITTEFSPRMIAEVFIGYIAGRLLGAAVSAIYYELFSPEGYGLMK